MATVISTVALVVVLVSAWPRMWDALQLTTGWGLPQRTGPPLLIVAHHGDLTRYPENSAEGVWAAAALHPDGIEFDLQVAASGTWYLLHDPTLDATTDGSGRISQLADDVIGRAVVDGGPGFEPEATSEIHVARLEAVLSGLTGFDGILYLDLQHAESIDVPSLLDMTAGWRVVVICESPAQATEVKSVDASVETMLSVVYAPNADVDGLFADATSQASPRMMEGWTRPVTLWVGESQLGEDERSLLRRAWATNVKAFLTNDVQAALGIRDALALGASEGR